MLRKLKLSDAEAIREINANDLGYDVPLAVTKRKLQKLLTDPEHHFLLAFEADRTVVGYVHAEVYDNLYSDTLFNVMGLAVAYDYRHQGIGKKLMKELEQEADRRGYRQIRLNSGTERQVAHEFYEKIGFISDKTQKRFLKEL